MLGLKSYGFKNAHRRIKSLFLQSNIISRKKCVAEILCANFIFLLSILFKKSPFYFTLSKRGAEGISHFTKREIKKDLKYQIIVFRKHSFLFNGTISATFFNYQMRSSTPSSPHQFRPTLHHRHLYLTLLYPIF
jgi:hypothetical protein